MTRKKSDRWPTFSRILAPFPVSEFLSTYFERRPLLVRGTAEKFAHLFTAGEFKDGLDEVTEIRAVFPALRQATIGPGDIKDMMDAGASICVTGMERAHPQLQDAARRLRHELGYAGRISFRAYLSPPGCGFDLHFDARVATTLQISGTKRWWYSNETAAPFPDENSPRDPEELRSRYRVPELTELRSVLLRPGDLLCLPAGTWHRAQAKTTSLALNLAFDHAGAGVFDVIVNALELKLLDDPAWRRPLPLAAGGSGRTPADVAEVLRERVDRMRDALREIRDDDAELHRAWKSSLPRP